MFRFFRYLIQNYFPELLTQLQVRGIKIRPKGKISVFGNSRKRTILYWAGVTSHPTTSLRVVNGVDSYKYFYGGLWAFKYGFFTRLRCKSRSCFASMDSSCTVSSLYKVGKVDIANIIDALFEMMFYIKLGTLYLSVLPFR